MEIKIWSGYCVYSFVNAFALFAVFPHVFKGLEINNLKCRPYKVLNMLKTSVDERSWFQEWTV